MILGRVQGTVWSTRKDPRLERYRLLVVRPYGIFEPAHDVDHLVAVDVNTDAGVGDDVVIGAGSPARWAMGGANYPVDATVLGVVDRCQLQAQRGDEIGPLGLRRRALSLAGRRQPRGVQWLDDPGSSDR